MVRRSPGIPSPYGNDYSWMPFVLLPMLAIIPLLLFSSREHVIERDFAVESQQLMRHQASQRVVTVDAAARQVDQLTKLDYRESAELDSLHTKEAWLLIPLILLGGFVIQKVINRLERRDFDEFLAYKAAGSYVWAPPAR
jgi:hypothetical protein